MNILISWDDPDEAELISLYLTTEENEAKVATTPEATWSMADAAQWDVILMSTTSPDAETAFGLFTKLKGRFPNCPIVGACRSEDVFLLARFFTAGMRNYVLRDVGGDFVFLLLATLESTVQAVRAEREQRVAERMREEIESVRRFQEAAIPTRLHAPRGYGVAGRYESSQIRVVGGKPVVLAGGDYYDVFPVDAQNAGIVIGDAAGHGMRACMSITVLQTLMQTVAGQRFRKTADYVNEINRRFCDQKFVRRDGSLITLLYGVLRLDRHEFQWTTAGHPIPILQNRLQGTVQEVATFDIAGPPLGVDADFRYQTVTTTIPSGGRLLIYTDGLAEASPDENTGEQFGFDGIKRSLEHSAERSVEHAIQALMDDSHSFTRGNGRHDDTSVLLLERL